jgi:4-hydroxybenzoate polyprenyltransferase
MNNESNSFDFYSFLRLIRTGNLLIIAATQYLFGYFVINGLLYYPNQKITEDYNNYQSIPPINLGLQLSHFDFFLLVLSTVLIAAAGYIINDYFDVRTDRINKPSNVIIDKGIKRRLAMLIHTLFNVIGVALGFYVAWKIGNWKFGMIHLLMATLLWFYSTTFKKMFLAGNLMVAFFTAVVPLVIALFDVYLLQIRLQNQLLINPVFRTFIQHIDLVFYLRLPFYFAFVFALFAFLTNLMREIVKDMEDMAGDMETGGQTMPIAIGVSSAKRIVQGINILTIALLVIAVAGLILPNADFVWYKTGKALEDNQNQDFLSSSYIFILLLIPLFLFSLSLSKSKTPQTFRRSGMLLKWVMVAGILYSVVIWYTFTQPIQ